MTRHLHIGKFFSSGAGLFASLLGNAFIFLIIARAFGAADFGRFALIYATASVLGLMVDFGYPQRFLKDFYVYSEKHGGLPSRVLATKLAFVVLASFANLVVSLAMGIDLALMAVIWTGIVLVSFGAFFGSCLRAMGEHRIDSTNLLLANSSGAAIATALYLSGSENPFHYFALFSLLGSIYLFLSYRAFRKQCRIVLEPISIGKCVEEVRGGISYAADIWVTRSFGFLDVLVLSLFVSNAGLGLYQAGQKLLLVAFAVNQIINNVFLPIFSAREREVGLDTKSLLAIIAGTGTMGVAVAAVFYLIFPVAVDILYGDGFEETKVMGFWLALAILFRLLSLGPSIWVVAAGRQTLRFMLNAFNMAVFLGLCLFFAPRYGFVGGAMATAISTLIWAGSFIVAGLVIAKHQRDQGLEAGR
ncbi:oligosaccharide flippase family protein [Qipengyuania xiapuensis]|uniref:Oligosaccharide flippase family protein n=1 Tax=Qipengyuania xiapuensis TaxID=2867236 RepID=A0ABX8ZVE4_9SPHN|nr:oligosaccharide flippase family protein [Qipengyuania xiapuensis]QZD92874.1 oligosaccharide flippase family protein [Qipengyuania xiapuensis]